MCVLKKRRSLSTFLTYHLSNTLSVAYSSRVAKLDLLQIYDAFINTSLLVESITDMCRVKFFRPCVHLASSSSALTTDAGKRHFLPRRETSSKCAAFFPPRKDLHGSGSKRTPEWTGGNEENSERFFSQNGCVSPSRSVSLGAFSPPAPAVPHASVQQRCWFSLTLCLRPSYSSKL